MEWNDWIGKRIFVQLRHGAVYSGNVLDVDSTDDVLFFMTIEDKFGERITFCHSEILKIKEEELKKEEGK